jgi:hypothetical protein
VQDRPPAKHTYWVEEGEGGVTTEDDKGLYQCVEKKIHQKTFFYVE